MKPLDKMTKAELLSVIATKDHELRTLRDRVAVLGAPVTASRPTWLAEHEARREAIAAAKAEALRTGKSVKAVFHV